MAENITDSTLVIGIIGRIGSGKGTTANRFVELAKKQAKSAERITFSDILSATLDTYGIEKTRHNLQQLALFIQAARPDGLGYAMQNAIVEANADVVVVDGIRWPADYELIRRFPKHLLIYLHATPEVRFGRLKQRVQKPGENTIDYATFLKMEAVPTETDIDGLGEKADLRIESNGELAFLEQQIDELWRERVSPALVQ